MVDPLRLTALLERLGSETAALRRLAGRTAGDLLPDRAALARAAAGDAPGGGT